jgi:hypothetical protein
MREKCSLQTWSVTMMAVAFLSLVWVIHSSAQEVIKNPMMPPGKSPARPLELLEVLRITDKGDEFYFNSSPGGFASLGMDADGHIYAQSGKDQILKFSSEGTFIKNIVRGGQGPGEVSQYFSFLVGDEEIFVIDYGQARIIRLSSDGQLINQWKTLRAYNDFIGILNDGLIFSRANYPPFGERTGKLMDVPHEILRVPLDGSEEKLVHTYPVLQFLGQGYMATWAPFHAALSDDGRYLFVNHTPEYEISILDQSIGKIIRTFKRKYKRIEHVPHRGEAEFFKKHNFKRAYETDIKGLFIFGDRLWVKTSTEDKEKGALFDVYSFDGIYRGAFFMKKNIISIQRGCLLAWEMDEEGSLSVVVSRPK